MVYQTHTLHSSIQWSPHATISLCQRTEACTIHLQSCGGRTVDPRVREQVTLAQPCRRNWISTVSPVTIGVFPVKHTSPSAAQRRHDKIQCFQAKQGSFWTLAGKTIFFIFRAPWNHQRTAFERFSQNLFFSIII